MARLLLGDRTVDLVTGEVSGQGTLRPTERALLAALAAEPERTFSLHELHVEVWGYAPAVNSRAAYSCIHRLRAAIEPDPKRPVHLVAERAEGYRLVGSRLQSGAEPLLATNAPAAVDLFFGRADALAALYAYGRTDRPLLLTLVGPGGAGKTRLACEAALASTLPGGAWVADLVAAETASDVCARVAVVLPGRPAPGPDTIGRSLAALGPCLLVLDNAEDALAPVADLVRTWAAAAPDCRLLATSRRRLGLRGERVVEVRPLAAGPAAALLVDRVGRRSPSMAAALDDDDVAALVEATDGLPLAIEIAAANVALVGVGPVLAALRSAGGLVARTSDAPDRHRALDTVVADSWTRLSAEQQKTLATLACFDGAVGFDVFDALGIDDVAERLAELADAALIVTDVRPGRLPSWRTLVTVRALVRRARPMDTDPVFGRIAARLLQRWEEATREDRVPSIVPPVFASGLSMAVAKQLADWSRASGATERHRSLLVVLVFIAYGYRALDACDRWIEEGIALEPAPGDLAALLRYRGLAAIFRADVSAILPVMQEGFAAAIAGGRPGLAAQILYDGGGMLARTNRRAEAITAIALMRQTCAELPAMAAACGEGGALTLECRLAEIDGDMAWYDRAAERAVEAYLRGGQPVQAAWMAGWRAMGLLLVEQFPRAERMLDEAIAILEQSREARRTYLLGSQYEVRGWALRMMGRFAEAHREVTKAVKLQMTSLDVIGFAPVLFEEGLALTDLGRTDEAIERFEAAIRYPYYDVNARSRKGVARIVHRSLTAGEAAAIPLAASMTAESEGVPETLGLYFRHLEAQLRLGQGDTAGALGALAEVVLPPHLREPVSDVLLLRAELLLRLRRRDAALADLARLESYGPGPQTHARIDGLRELIAAIEGAPPGPQAPSIAYAGWRAGGWSMLTREWIRRLRTGESPRVDGIVVTPLMPDLRWARQEAAGPVPAWLDRPESH